MAFRISGAIGQVLSGNLSVFGGPRLSGVAAGRLRAEQMGIIKRYLPWMMLANAFNASTVIAGFWKTPDRTLALVWASIIIGFAAFHVLKGEQKPETASVSVRSIRRAVCNAFALGSIWAALPILFFNSGSQGQQLLISCLCAGMLGGGAFAFASIPVAAVAFSIPLVVGSGVAILRHDETVYSLIGLLLIVYTCVLLRGVFVQSFSLSTRTLRHIKAEEEARTDALTKLPNRLLFYHELGRSFARMDRFGEPFALLYLDMEDFKAVNDEFGHSGGDELLVQIAARLRAAKRGVDFAARIGGDEFAIIVPNVTPDQALAAAHRIVEAMEWPFVVEGLQMRKRMSVGIAMAPLDSRDGETLVPMADEAMYQAKNNAPGSIAFFNPDHLRIQVQPLIPTLSEELDPVEAS